MKFKFLELEERGATRVLYLDSPPVNGLNLEVVEELHRAFSLLEQSDPAVRCMVLASRVPDVFIAGADIKMIRRYMEGASLAADMIHFNTRLQETITRVESLPFPVVAAINGHALGAGLELALACDLRFMAKGRGRIGLPEVNLGLLPGAGGTQRLGRLIGRSRAKDMIFTGRLLDADGALAAGVVDRAFPAEELLEESLKYAGELEQRPTVSISVVKTCINQGLDGPIEEGLRLEMWALEKLLETEDAREGVRAFLDKRKPVFRGV